jgi:hypothetical protein
LNRRTIARHTEELHLEGAGFARPEIEEKIHEQFHVSKRTVQRDFRTRADWQFEIMGLSKDSAKDCFYETVNRYEQNYRRYSLVYLQATESSSRIGAVKGMVDTQVKKAEIMGALVPNLASGDQRRPQSLIDDEALKALSPEEEQIVLKAVLVFQKKRERIMQLHGQENEKVSGGVNTVGA